MKPHGSGRALTFAVTGALLGGSVAAGGCGPKQGGPYTNTGPVPEDIHVNPGPDEDPGAVEDGAGDEVTPTNPGPQPEPPSSPEPEPETLDPGTNNVRKVEDAPRPRPKQK